MDYPNTLYDASDLLAHYFKQAGVELDGDNRREIERIVEIIYGEAVDAAQRKPGG